MQTMTPHEINLAIGKSLGFAQCPIALSHGFPPEYCYRKDTYIGELPDFYGSLDRMHEVERSIQHKMQYVIQLHRVCNNDQGPWDLPTTDLQFNYVTATAAQRAEAYLRTLNLWTNTNAPSRQDATVNNLLLSM